MCRNDAHTQLKRVKQIEFIYLLSNYHALIASNLIFLRFNNQVLFNFIAARISNQSVATKLNQ